MPSCLRAPEHPESPLGRALAIAMTAAADQTFRDVVRGAIAQRDAIGRWIAKAGGDRRMPSPICHSRSASIPATSRETVEAEFLAGQL